MDLRSYLQKKKLSQEEFGRLIGVTQGMVWQILNKHRPISAKLAREIDRATQGEVSREELRPDIFDGQPARRRRVAVAG